MSVVIVPMRLGNVSKSVSGQGLHEVIKERKESKSITFLGVGFSTFQYPPHKNTSKYFLRRRGVEIVGKAFRQVSFSAQSKRFCS